MKKRTNRERERIYREIGVGEREIEEEIAKRETMRNAGRHKSEREGKNREKGREREKGD